MASIRTILGTLTAVQLQTLQYARENGISQYIEYVPGRFVGVFATHIEYLTIEQSEGCWSTGTIHKEVEHATD